MLLTDVDLYSLNAPSINWEEVLGCQSLRGLQLREQTWASLLPQLSQLFAHCKWLEVGHATGDVIRVERILTVYKSSSVLTTSSNSQSFTGIWR
jgi:hypothetical protein